ncbi:hypothetical protein V3W47_17360 [Deinococcus sp. YIM 134068]|uniref:hypothetical protein n=1 Tax=Deinococcus lichenicola TaxID=3118910 RepID=UPI002F92D09A
MYLKFLPTDFEPEDSKQHLEIHLCRNPGALESWLESEGWDGTLTDAEQVSKQAVLERLHAFLALPRYAPTFDLSWVQRGWKLNDDWDDAVFVGEGEGLWLAVHWFTTT